MKKTRMIIIVACIMAIGLVFTGCSCSKDSSTTNSTSSQSSSNSSGNNGSKDANSTDGATASATDGATANNANANAASNIVGSWKYEKGMSGNADHSYIFNADRTGKMINRLAGGEVDFTYEAKDGKLTMNTPSLPSSTPKDYSINGNTLIVKDSAGNDIYYTKE